MLNNKSVAVVIPVYNEEKQILSVLKTIPNFVDKVIIINDNSIDETENIIKNFINKYNTKTKVPINNKKIKKNKYNSAEFILKELKKEELSYYPKFSIYNKNHYKDRFVLISFTKNSGVGTAISKGYRYCRDENIFCTAVMAGDGQMDPNELEKICLPVINKEVDYVKGNRLSHRSAYLVVPRIRYLGNSTLSLLTKIASGYWHISDTQTGFTAISLNALKAIRLEKIYPYYGCPNDILVKLNIAFCSIKEVPIKPVYGVGEKSKMKILKVIPRITCLLFKSFWKRLYIKYLFRDFHPLFLLYHFAFFILIFNIPYTIQAIESLAPGKTIDVKTALLFMFCATSGLQALFFAMWMDMQDNERLQKI